MKRNTKLKKNPVTVTTAGQRDISAFFSPPKQKGTVSSIIKPLPTSTATAPTNTLPQNNNGKTSLSKHLSSSSLQYLSPSKKSILGDLENIPPSSPDLIILSPDLILSVPETPDSQIRPTCTSSSRDASGLGKVDTLSPVCRSSHRERSEERRSGSVKRLFSPHDESNNAKRPRTDNTQLIRKALGPKTNGVKVTSIITTIPTIPSLKKTCSPRDHLLKECLQSIGQSERSQGEGSAFSLSRANQPTFIDGRKQGISLKPVSVRRVSLQSSKGSSEQECVFTVITEQKLTEEKPSLPALTQHTSTHTLGTAPESDTCTLNAADMHTPAICTATAVPQTGSGEEVQRLSVDGTGAPGTAATSSDKDGISVASVDQDIVGGTAMISSDHNGVGGFETLDDGWFDEPMDQSTANVQVEKPKTARKVPDHVILCGGHNNRYWVLDVEEKPREKLLTITSSKALHPTETCLLKDGWETSPVSCGSVVHLEGRCDAGSWLVDREQGFLVLLPDYLISGTSVANSIRCMRRAVLSEMFKSFDGGSKQMLNGTMVHEIFQKAALAKDFSTETLTRLADEALHSPQHLGTMYSLGLSQEEMKQELSDYLPSLKDWANEYLNSPNPKPISFKLPSSGGAPSRGKDASAVAVTVTELADIEENVWSPRFGLKGKIDLTARVRIQRPGKGGIAQERIMALELKTGKETNSIEHRSQVILYTLMSMERNISAEAGFLLYLKTGNVHPVVASHMDRRELLKLRNMMAHHLGNTVEKGPEHSHLSRLPDILTDRQTCQYCPQRRNCALYERVVNSGSPDNISSDVVRDFVQQETGHLTPLHLNYFSKWLLLCCLETVTMENKNGRKHVWLQTAEEREKSGGCAGNLELLGPVTVQSEEVILHHFQRQGTASQQGVKSSLAEGDRVVASDQEGRLIAVASGYLCAVSGTLISCTLDKDLSKYSGVLFRLDHDEGVIGLSTHLTNLSRLMEDSQDSNRMRELIVDLRPPEFISSLSSVLPRDAKDIVANILKGLNKPQKQAMKKVLLSKDYTLIVGMPGTGKTTTICTLVRILHACGLSVLLTSYTHSAVDNILLKLKRFRVGFLRLGRGQKIHPDILPYTEERRRKDAVHNLPELEQLYNKELVVATTCMSTKHPIFSRRRFDFCIIDEASQISQPICLGPLFYANRFVLVGDHQQLPPIVQNQEARSLGMDESLFKRLELHSEAVVQLNVQYRMNSQIMSLSNSLMYDGRLECGSERTATALLSLPFLVSVQSQLSSLAKTRPQHDLSWIQSALLPSNPVCFLDTSQVPALERVEQGGVSNHIEAALIHTLLTQLIKAGCKPSDIGVIAPYRQQLKTISALLQSPEFSAVEVNTVDRYQGRDKSLIVLSFVRSTTEEGNLGELLKDWRRLNVAVTRAKHKLLMVGSALTLRRYAPLEKLLNHLQQENMIIKLPPATHEALPSMHL